MPITTNSAELPVGIQAMGPAGGDRTTVEIAALLTEVLGGYRVPPMQGALDRPPRPNARTNR